MSKEDKIIEILERLTNKVDMISEKIDRLDMKVDRIEKTEETVFISIEEQEIDQSIEDRMGMGIDLMLTPEERIEMLELEIDELREEINNIQQITAINLGDIAKLKAKDIF